MVSPPKPWETGGSASSTPAAPAASAPLGASSSGGLAGNALQSTMNGTTASGATGGITDNFGFGTDSSLPPRPERTSTGGYGTGMGSTLGTGYGGYGSGMYGNSMYGGGGMYGSGMYGGGYGGGMYGSGYGGMGYGGYGGMYGNRMMDQNPSYFVQRAESSSRPAFQAIEDIVGAVTSVSMMLESTYQATYSSFRAVLGVADQFGRLRSQLVGVFSTLAAIRMMRRVLYRILLAFGIKMESLKPPPVEEGEVAQQRARAWPIIIFLGVVFGVPWFIWKLLAYTYKETAEQWEDPTKVVKARATHPFQGEHADEMNLQVGEEIEVLRPDAENTLVQQGWVRARKKEGVEGIVPLNRITPIKAGDQVDGSPAGALQQPGSAPLPGTLDAANTNQVAANSLTNLQHRQAQQHHSQFDGGMKALPGTQAYHQEMANAWGSLQQSSALNNGPFGTGPAGHGGPYGAGGMHGAWGS
eukprot:Clim_evm59s134 gene=Clim_evmTU59s134